ncbi:hypothetical protein [Paraglaciecola aestuariivivens]
MYYTKFKWLLSLTLIIVTASWSTHAALVKKMSLSEMVGNADKVFRATVLSKEPSSVHAGGGELSTIVYTLRIDDAIKGDFGSGKEAQVLQLTMLGSMKSSLVVGNQKRLINLQINPDLELGSDYVLFTTARSPAGLSTTVGLGQGLFRLSNDGSGPDMAVNGLDNKGIFSGPVSYDELKAAIFNNIN